MNQPVVFVLEASASAFCLLLKWMLYRAVASLYIQLPNREDRYSVGRQLFRLHSSRA